MGRRAPRIRGREMTRFGQSESVDTARALRVDPCLSEVSFRVAAFSVGMSALGQKRTNGSPAKAERCPLLSNSQSEYAGLTE